MIINIREYRRGNHKWTIQRKYQHKTQDEDKQKKKHNTIRVGHHNAKTNTNKVKKDMSHPIINGR